MSHPDRYRDDDADLTKLREICLRLPDAEEKISHGHPVFCTKKIFAIFGAVVKGDHYADDYSRSVVFLPDADEREALLCDDRFFAPAYYGPYGWLGLNFAVGEVDWDEVAELVHDSYRNTATKTRVAKLNEMLAR
ncbi:MAG: MmcQ/YjbR family DNA-binding protein [Acidimicrobiales bacterium]